MFKFIISEELDRNVNNEYINEMENKMNIKFPAILKEYYMKHNFSNVNECSFSIEGMDFALDCIMPLKYGNVSVEKNYEYVLEDEYIPNNYIPFAVDMTADNYYWDSKNGNVYYISHENVEDPILICNSVDEFFDILNRSCEETITIENLNYKSNNIENDEIVENNKYDVDKILKYNGKVILKCNLILLACIVICLIIMPITDGLSVIIAGIFAVWLLIFIIIDIINRIVSNVALKKRNLDEIKKELLDYKTRKIDGLDTYLTDNYIVSNSKTIKITKYSDVVWIYLARPMGTVAQQGAIATAYQFGGTPVIAHLKNGKKVTIALVKSREQLNKIFAKITNKNRETLVGKTPENIKRYENINKNFKIKNKITGIMLIVVLLLIIIGAIFFN